MIRVELGIKSRAVHVVKQNVFYVDTDSYKIALEKARDEFDPRYLCYLNDHVVFSDLELIDG